MKTGAGRPGYFGTPIVKPPVWTWEIPLYLFVGGLAGMSALLAAAALALGADRDPGALGPGGVAGGLLGAAAGAGAPASGGGPLARAALQVAAVGSVVSAALLVSDLGRPRRFLNMLRVFKPRSPMSVGAWLLVAFGACAVPAALLAEWTVRVGPGAEPAPAATSLLLALLAAGAAVSGAVLATYTGVLLAATANPAWAAHRGLLPAHFGIAALGSAAALLELLGFPLPALDALGILAAAAETAAWAGSELVRHGAADRALRRGYPGVLLRAAGLLMGPLALSCRLLAWIPAAAISFLAGALVSRFGWLAAGRAAGRDPEAALAAGP